MTRGDLGSRSRSRTKSKSKSKSHGRTTTEAINASYKANQIAPIRLNPVLQGVRQYPGYQLDEPNMHIASTQMSQVHPSSYVASSQQSSDAVRSKMYQQAAQSTKHQMALQTIRGAEAM